MTDLATSLMPTFPSEQANALVELLSHIESIYGEPPSVAVVGSNMIVNGTFASGLGSWTFTGWSWSLGTAVHNSGNTNSLSQTVSVVNNTWYLIQSTVSGPEPLAGISNVYVDGTLCPGYNSIETSVPSTNFVSYLATSTGDVTFEIRVTTDFVGAYDNISMWPLVTNARSILDMFANGEGIPLFQFGGTIANRNLGVGQGALLHNLINGSDNTAIGINVLSANLTGDSNTGIGTNTLRVNTVGYANTAVGTNALNANTGGFSNTAIGAEALSLNTYGTYNTAVGLGAMTENIHGIFNTVIGVNAGYTITGNYNVAIGANAIGYVRPNTGTHNNALGIDCMRAITSGKYNQAMGYETMFFTSTGQGNDAYGHQALRENTTGNYNACFGYQTLANLASGDSNLALGASAGNFQTAGSRNVVIGQGVNAPNLTGSDQLNIGNTIYGDLANDKVGIGRVPTAKFAVSGLSSFANNAAALGGGLTAGDFYLVTASDPRQVAVVF